VPLTVSRPRNKSIFVHRFFGFLAGDIEINKSNFQNRFFVFLVGYAYLPPFGEMIPFGEMNDPSPLGK
jgi:hypothetical protein